MSATGRPEREHRSAQREGSPVSATGRPGRQRAAGRAGAQAATRAAKVAALAACTLALVATGASATPDARSEAEIQSLLAFVEASGCQFVRGGTAYDGREARAHLERKYRYAKSMLSTADQFVLHVASGSSTTGEPYAVRCGSREQPARTWLSAELARLRAASPPPARAQ